jgi:hypothetical protein
MWLKMFFGLGLIYSELTDWDVNTLNLLIMLWELKFFIILNLALYTGLHLLVMHARY